jgi:hypothetical protein
VGPRSVSLERSVSRSKFRARPPRADDRTAALRENTPRVAATRLAHPLSKAPPLGVAFRVASRGLAVLALLNQTLGSETRRFLEQRNRKVDTCEAVRSSLLLRP